MSRAVRVFQSSGFVLPATIIGHSDVSRLLREIERVDYDLETQQIRTPGAPLAVPNMSRGLSETIETNKIEVDKLESRRFMMTELRKIKDHSPEAHITFATDAEPDTISELIAWIRQNLHQTALITVGLQPSLIGGCVVRTPDHIYDFSLRNRFHQELPELAAYVRALAAKTA